MIQEPFDRNKHLYQNDGFVELVKDAVRFFNGTPIYPLPLSDKFLGTGVYALKRSLMISKNIFKN